MPTTDWPTARAEFSRLLGHLRTSRTLRLGSPNVMTPDVLGIIAVDDDLIEVSTGTGFRHERIYGVTYARLPDGSCDPRDGVHLSLPDVLAAVTAERCAQCGDVLDPTVFHDDDDSGHELCESCCPTCREEA